MQKIEEETAPKLAAHRDAIHFNAKLFARLKEVYHSNAEHDRSAVAQVVAKSTTASANHANVARARQSRRRIRYPPDRSAHRATACRKSEVARLRQLGRVSARRSNREKRFDG